jgi:methyl-accepting chemotaxis protein
MAVAWLTSIDRQLQTIILAVSGAVLLLMGIFLVCLDLYLAKEGATRDLFRQADLLSILSRDAVLTADRAAGERALSTLRLYPTVTLGILYDHQGRELARYDRTGPGPGHSAATRALRAVIGTDAVEIRRAVPIETGTSGMILLLADLSSKYNRAMRYAALVFAIIVFGLTLAWILGSRLHRLISSPILDLTAIAGKALAERDFSLRVQTPGSGDLGILIERFNALLQQIQEQQQT